MLVEPTPLQPRRRRNPVLLVALFALVPALVAAVALPSLLDDEAVDPASAASAVPAVSAAPPASAVPPVSAASPSPWVDSTTTTEGMTADAPAYPASALGIATRGVSATRAARDAGQATGLIAVTGYLTVMSIDDDCPAASGASPQDVAFCERRAFLSDSPISPFASTGDIGWGALGPHLHPQLLPGIGTPLVVNSEVQPARPRPVPVVVLGRFNDPRSRPCSMGSRCGDEFVIERVVWAAGRWQDRERTLDPSLAPGIAGNVAGTSTPSGRDRRLAVSRALPASGPFLSEAKVTLSTLARIDPALVGALRSEPTGPVWYVRVMLRGARAGLGGPPGEPTVAAVVLDDRTGSVLATTAG